MLWTTYQGCTEFQQMLEQMRFDTATDRLWLMVCLANHGVLRLAKWLENTAITVLGIHEPHLPTAQPCHEEKWCCIDQRPMP